MHEFKYIDTIINNNPRDDQVVYSPKALEFIDGSIVLRANPNLFVLENYHFEHDVKIKIFNKTEIKIKNCTFDGTLIIDPQAETALNGIEVRILKTIVFNKINFNRVANYTVASIDCCVTGSINFKDDTIDCIDIYRSEIDEVYFEGTIVKELTISRSFIKKILHYGLISTSVDIDLESVLNHYGNFSEIKSKSFVNTKFIEESNKKIKTYKKHIKSKKSKNPSKSFAEFKADMINNISVTKRAVAESKDTATSHCLKYIQIIKKSKNESIDDSVISELNYLYAKNKKYPWFIKILLSSIGFFYRPSQAILCSFATIVGFGILFYFISHFGNRFLSYEELTSSKIILNVARELINSVYFSGITFFTIGYSDIIGEAAKSIEPVRQVLILCEAAIGIILSSTILISFMNKYLTKK